jgi:hypothetical protein
MQGGHTWAGYLLNGNLVESEIRVRGIHNAFNCAAALAALRQVMGGELDGNKMVDSLRTVGTAFGRGETISLDGQEYELVLVKNPAGFRIALNSFEGGSFASGDSRTPVMIAINDDYADGRDVSWLYDVDFTVLNKGVGSTKSSGGKQSGKSSASSNWPGTVISGSRGYDLALKFDYTDNPVAFISTDLQESLNKLGEIYSPGPRRIYATYTAMLKIRALLMGKKGSTL